MARKYFACSYRLDSGDRHLIWYTNEHDGLIIDGASDVPSFKNLDALQTYALNHGWIVNAKEPVLHDLDETARWLSAPTASVNCVNALCAWNLFGDIARSVGDVFDSDRSLTNPIYEKLFWGNNLPPVTPTGEHYDPVWTAAELQTLHAVLKSGLSLFRNSVRCV